MGSFLRLARAAFGKTPFHLVFFVTSKCNARCRYCFYWDQIASEECSCTWEILIALSMMYCPRIYPGVIAHGLPSASDDKNESGGDSATQKRSHSPTKLSTRDLLGT